MISSKSRYVREYRRYQRTHRRIITSSKCRPRNSAGRRSVTIHPTRSVLAVFATEPFTAVFTTLIERASRIAGETDPLRCRELVVRDLYLSRHQNAKFWQDYSDFAFYRLGVSAVYFIGGFGVMGWVSAEDYTTATPDPLAEAAPGIIQHMNADHAEPLKQIAGYYAGEVVDEAAMTAVDRLGFHLRLKSGDRIYGRRIAFIREVANKDDARSVLVEMVRQARTS
jgi:putative heme iron utilization protein